MSPWYSWRASPGCSASKNELGDLERASAWYNRKLAFYKYYTRERVVDFLKKKMIQFYEDCPAAWQELLDRSMSSWRELRWLLPRRSQLHRARLASNNLAMRILMMKSVDSLSGIQKRQNYIQIYSTLKAFYST